MIFNASKITITFLWIILHTPLYFHAQSEFVNIDSLNNLVNKEGTDIEKEERYFALLDEYAWEEPEFSLPLADRILALDHLQKDSTKIMEAIRYKGMSKRAQGNYVQSLEYYQQNYDFHQRKKDTLGMAVASSQLGIINLFNGKMSVAQKYLLESLDFFTLKGSQSQIAGANNGLASFYLDMDMKEKSMQRYQLALKAYEEAEDLGGMANVHANLGLSYIESKEFDKAEYHLREQGRLDSIVGTDWGLGFFHDFMGYLYSEKGELQKAYGYYQNAVKIREKETSHYNMDESRVSLSDVLYKMKKYDEAIDYAYKIFENNEKQSSLTHLQSANELLAQSYEAKGDFRNALKYYKEYKSVSDSIYQSDKLDEIAEKDGLFQKAEQDNKIALLNAENESTAKVLKQKNRTIGIGGTSLVLISLLTFFLFRLLSKVNIQKTQLASALTDKDLLIKEIHHRVKNNLQLVSSLLSLQSKSIDDPAVSGAIEDGKARVRSMALIHQDLYQKDNLTGVNVNSYLEELCEELFNTYNINNENISLELDVEEIVLDVDTIIPLGLILNELITNTIKYAFPDGKQGTLKIGLKKILDELHLTVIDNGVGFQEHSNADSTSFGTTLIKALSRQLGGNMEIDQNNGTKISLVFTKFNLA